MSRTFLLWIVWFVATLAGGGAVAALMFVGGDRTALLPAETTGVHHQLEIACETCHAAKAFSSESKTLKALNKTCTTCHDEELAASNDSHPRKKFRNPRMADYWAKIDARYCTSCHVEHKPEITRPGAVTLAMDYCVACHSEGDQNVRVNRPSHAELTFDTCASSGCHNFHDNKALYEDFLVQHADQPWLKGDAPVHALQAVSWEPIEPKKDARALALEDAVAPADMLTAEALEHWAGSGHAEAGVNCAGCHAPKAEDDATAETLAPIWIAEPEMKTCWSCHKDQANTFRRGRHGMRSHPKIAKPRKIAKGFRALGLKGAEKSLPEQMLAWLDDPSPPPMMTVAEARIPMHDDALGESLSCNSCHTPHKADRREAAVEACAGCHADDHTAAYFDSQHYALWQAEVAGEAPLGSGVSCATCHMPKQEGRRKTIFTTHNQNSFLRPNEKMIRPVCMDCHGLGFAIDALADADLVARNFQGRPTVHIESIDWAMRRVKEGDQGANQ